MSIVSKPYRHWYAHFSSLLIIPIGSLLDYFGSSRDALVIWAKRKTHDGFETDQLIIGFYTCAKFCFLVPCWDWIRILRLIEIDSFLNTKVGGLPIIKHSRENKIPTKQTWAILPGQLSWRTELKLQLSFSSAFYNGFYSKHWRRVSIKTLEDDLDLKNIIPLSEFKGRCNFYRRSAPVMSYKSFAFSTAQLRVPSFLYAIMSVYRNLTCNRRTTLN